eukprot:8299871-Alexandrium_andersonii.AAC.2
MTIGHRPWTRSRGRRGGTPPLPMPPYLLQRAGSPLLRLPLRLEIALRAEVPRLLRSLPRVEVSRRLRSIGPLSCLARQSSLGIDSSLGRNRFPPTPA